ncbi:MAG TPA: ribosome-associated translation inhibitor RaiA [Candidatus Angelobacter sp.]|nr:ribosome-associated translation inhibitor RaiA [Candidatus Angelobacter sp.]
MKTNLKARNLDLSERLRTQVERKLRRLDRITHPEAEVEVELIANASHANDASQVAEVMLVNNGQVLRSSAAGATPIAALDIVVDKLERQLVRTKERPGSVRKRRADETVSVLEREATKTVGDESELEPMAAAAGPSVVKTKRFDMLPMFPEDAIDQMEELGHAFFVYLSAETDEVAVLYRRNDGNYGLIEPVVDRGRGSANGKGR